MNNFRRQLLAIMAGLSLALVAHPVYANSDYEDECFNNSCNAPPGQGGEGGAGGDAVATGGDATATGGSVVIGASDASDYPGTPASVYATRCANGASVSFPGGGATATSSDKFCNRLALAAFYAQVLNDPDKAKEIVEIAEDRLNRSGRLFGFPRLLHLDEIPLVGPFLFSN